MRDAPPPSFDPVPGARLAERLSESVPAIVEAWSRAVRADPGIHSDDSLSYAEFVDHIPKVVEKLCAVLRDGELGGERSAIRREARAHGLFRWRQGYDLGELMREIGHLREVLLASGAEAAEALDIAARQQHGFERVILRVIDEGQVATILTYVSERDREAAERDQAIAARDREIAERERRLQQTRLEQERSRSEALESAAAAKDDFLATLSHELRTPLTPILAWITILEKDRSPATLEAAARTLGRNARVLAQLIEDLLDVSRIVAGKLELAREPVDGRDVLRAACETVLPAATARGVSLVLGEPPEPLPLLGDPVRLQQVVWNLLSNGIKFSRSGGEVRIETAREGAETVIAVSDDGVGIAPGFLPYIFDRFRQQEGRPARGRGGLGLGLAIARSIAEAHGGRLIAHSEGEGRGSRFELRLPTPGAPAAEPA